jgi:hypothetical protein
MTQKSSNKSAARPLTGVGVTTGNTSAKRWSCTTCANPIAPGDGYIVVMDAKTGAYPNGPSDDSTLLKRARIQFGAYHRGCDPLPHADPYCFHVERADTLEKWSAWVQQVGEKTWMSKRDTLRMLAFWFTNRGLRHR